MENYTTDKFGVQVPEWAESLAVGDRVRWEAESGETGVSEILGFSTVPENNGQPVIEPPEFVRERYDDVDSVALSESDVVGEAATDEVERARQTVQRIQDRVVVRD